MNKREIGTQKELLAIRYLEEQNMQILEKNFRCRVGEIDIIAQDNDTIVFVEVKYRKNDSCGSPFEAVHFRKQNTIRQVAQFYLLKAHCSNCKVRFDVIGILGDQLEHLKNAF